MYGGKKPKKQKVNTKWMAEKSQEMKSEHKMYGGKKPKKQKVNTKCMAEKKPRNEK